MGPSRPIVFCSDSDSDDINPGYPAAHQLFPLPNLAPAPTTLDPHAVFTRDAAAFAYDAADSGDDANVDSTVDSEDGADDSGNDSENNGPPSSAGVDTDSAISISDDDSAISISDDDSAIAISDDGSFIDVSDNDSAIIIDDDYNANISQSLTDLATFDNNNRNMQYFTMPPHSMWNPCGMDIFHGIHMEYVLSHKSSTY
jgi:hypothetical protein